MKPKNIARLLAPSVLSADFASLGQAIALVAAPTAPGHPFIPTLLVDRPDTLPAGIANALMGNTNPLALSHFQITRGPTGFSL